MRARRRLLAGGAAAAVGAALAGAPALVAQEPSDAALVRATALDAAAGWRDALEAHRAPVVPPPGDAESVILLLDGPAAADAAPGDRRAAARRVSREQDRLAPVLADLGATVTFRYRVLVNAIGVRLPAGRLEAVAALPEVRGVVPVTYLAPAQAGGEPEPSAVPEGAAAPDVAGSPPARLALIDGGVDAGHPWLGGGIGPRFPIIGGVDLVDRDGDPSAEPGEPGDAHGTQLASLVLRSPALAGLEPEDVPRIVVHRVVAREAVDGRVRPLARTDRVLAALERAVDPDGDGATDDRSEVILMGLAAGFDGAGEDPLRDAVAVADRLGSTVVLPAGNDGPTFSRPGAVGGPAAAPAAIAVGGLSAPSGPRTADLDVRLGPAGAALGPLPLMGPDPSGEALPVRFARDGAGLATGLAEEHYASDGGGSAVEGALVVVARGEGTLAEKAGRARAAGAAALAVWDRPGPASFPAIEGDAGLGIPVVGLGRRQGEALARLVSARPDVRVDLAPRPAGDAPASVASFSSWGPTASGAQKPDLVAPAVARPAAWPGGGEDGHRTAPLTGTSAAAAEAAARALRLRVERPGLGPRGVHSVMVQSADPLPGVATTRQGAGVVDEAGDPDLRVAPAIVAARPGTTATIGLGDLSGSAGRYRVALETPGGGVTDLVDDVRVGAGGSARVEVPLPEGTPARGRLVVRHAGSGEPAAGAPLVPKRPATTPDDALGRPEVRTRSGSADALVRIGVLRREDGRVVNARLHGVRLHLVPRGEGSPLLVAGRKQNAALPAGTYRYLVAGRLASGLPAPAGTYRLRVTAKGPDGTVVRRESRPFELGG